MLGSGLQAAAHLGTFEKVAFGGERGLAGRMPATLEWLDIAHPLQLAHSAFRPSKRELACVARSNRLISMVPTSFELWPWL
eukprot:13479461-Alexandrium_andersonii.AAC.1